MQNHKKVIYLTPKLWTFYDYGEGGTNYIEDWYRSVSEEAQFLFDDILKQNQKIEVPRYWVSSRPLSGGELKGHQLWEFRFFEGDIQHRVIGTFGDFRKQAVLLLGCYHKMKVYTPRDALTTARKRATNYRDGKARIYERKVKTDQ